ncbi:MAG: HAD-IA family hydrolase [Dehalococcoidia bacterium]|nr:HAD-IA family hydrolase [Dehalococcoidia bacterium]
MAYRAVLFDLDGTLLDTLKDLADCCNRVLRDRGMSQHPLEAYRHFIGDGREALVRRILPADRRDPATVAQAVSSMDDDYSLHWADATRPYPGIPDLLKALTERGVAMAVISNKPDEFTRQAVSQLLAEFRFSAVVGARPAVPNKPDPAAALEIARGLGVKPSEVLFLGDTDIDMKTARAAGMRPVGALWGFRDAAELLAGGADALLRTPTDLLKML